MCKKLCFLISFVLVLGLASTSYGIVIGDFEDQMDGWVKADPCDPNIVLSYSTTGATLGAKSLKIADATGGGFERAIMYDLVANNDVNEFRKNLKVSLDVTRLYNGIDWGVYNLGWSELHLIVEAGSTKPGSTWALGRELSQIANWGSWNGDSPMSVTYDYSLILNQIDFNNLTYLGLILATNWGGYTPGGVYYLDNVQMVGEGMAYDPNPANGARSLEPDITLSWTQGAYAAKHDVYFGTDFDKVNDANGTNPLGVLKSKDRMTNTYDPTLALGTTYYWRIDEVNDACSPGLWKGAVWDFTTAYLGVTGVVIGDWEKGMNGWEATWQGKTTFHYSTTGATLGNYSLGVQPVKKTPEDPAYWIIQRSGLLNPTGMVLRLDVTMIASEWGGQDTEVGPLVVQTDLPVTWSSYTPTAIKRTTGLWSPNAWSGPSNAYKTYTFDLTGPDSLGVTHTDWADATKMTILLALQNPAEGPGSFYLDNARLTDPRLAFNPRPANYATDTRRDPTLAWNAGKIAGTDITKHDVYFGTDFDKVNDANRTNPLGVLKSQGQTTKTYVVPGTLALNTIYYWRIDEIVTGPPLVAYKGDVWSFTTQDYRVVDDFESYTNTSPNIICETWKDGLGFGGPGNGTGSQAGYRDPNYAEVTIVHEGAQSMPFDYNNLKSPNYSEATRTFATAQDWTIDGVKALTLWLKGYPSPPAGTFVESPPGTYTMTASGTDIGDVPDLRKPLSYHDEFHYAYTQANGDCWIIAKVQSVSNTDPWAKAGIMMRDSTDPNSLHAMVYITPANGVAFQYRATTGGAITNINQSGITAPYWIVLERAGESFTAYYSPDGTSGSWVVLGGASIPMPNPICTGLALTAHNAAAVCTAVFSNVSTSAGTSPSTWTSQDIGIKSNVAAPVYVTLKDSNANTATVTHDDPNIALAAGYQEWLIPLARFTSLNPSLDLKNIQKMTLGTGGAGNRGTGTIYFDDIRLYLPRCMPDRLRSAADFTGSDCVVDYRDLQLLTNNWLLSPADPNIDLYEDGTIDLRDYAILASMWLEVLLWP